MTTTAASGTLPLRALGPLALTMLIWGSTWTVIRYQLGVVDPAWSTAYRFAIAALAMVLLARWQGASLRIRRSDLPLLAAIGLAQFSLNYLFIYHAEAHVTSGLVAMIVTLLIIPNALLGWLFLGQRFSRNFALGSLISLAGMLLLFRQEIVAASSGGGRAALGIALALCGMLAASAGNLLQSGRRAARLHWSTLLFWSMTAGAIINALLALVLAGPPAFDPRPAYILSLLYLALFGSTITFPIYLSAMRQIGPGRAAYAGVMTPVVAMIFSTVLEGYRWSGSAIAGSLLALAGLVVALKARSPAS
ncbi:DMT family transporter [Sphingomonas sp. SRS2]|uniref:DMT family transporter n=1 Tax=Sphingomonas sp. SRS2 TaxID=133190 RepID=UPI000618463D|nr:DMT family transporter [Sphingomonas sp. SRS2]KKC26468.1 hypothetical protein WP12_08315 [Sphingomonas sp. SRS2]